MKRALIIYATREGQTAKIAERIAGAMHERGFEVSVVDAANETETAGVALSQFDLLVFGASMHAGGLEKELVEYVNNHRAQIESRPRSFFLVLLSAATRDAELKERWLADARNKMNEQLETAFDDVETIAGALAYTKYSLPMRWMMRRIAAKAGGDTDVSRDYEYTDWEQVASYAERLARQLV